MTRTLCDKCAREMAPWVVDEIIPVHGEAAVHLEMNVMAGAEDICPQCASLAVARWFSARGWVAPYKRKAPRPPATPL